MAAAVVDQRQENLRRMVQEFPFYARHCLKIIPKEGGNPIPFVFNKAQQHIHSKLEAQLAEAGMIRALLLKGRQQGGSTYIQARMRWKIKHRKGRKGYVVAHEQKASDNLFRMAKRFHELEPDDVRPSVGKSDSHTLWFDKLDSRFEIATAGSKEIGRSGTAQYMHASEYAFWDNAEEHWKGIGQVIPSMANTEIIVETTANGINNDFHRRWVRAVAGLSDFIAIFVPWFWQDEYRKTPPEDWERTDEDEELAELYGLEDDQLYWRRSKIEDDFNGDDNYFKQEYPCNAQEAFVTDSRNLLIPIVTGLRAQQRPAVKSGHIVAGLDPARFGDDKTALVIRQGRSVIGYKTFNRFDVMEVSGVAVNILRKNPNIVKLFVDMIGIGAGVVDRLHELGFKDRVIGVNFGSKAGDEDRYVNKRSECWGEMADWIKDGTIPDTDEWLADVTSTAFKYDSKGRIKLEPKEDVKKELGKSPDLADALALTFAEPVIITTKMATMPPRRVIDNVTGY